VENKWLDIYPLVKPNNLESQRRGAVIMVVSLQARSNEADSRIHRFKISWDGKWEDGDAEMSQHLVLKDITQG
jgi:hypothetical protein